MATYFCLGCGKTTEGENMQGSECECGNGILNSTTYDDIHKEFNDRVKDIETLKEGAAPEEKRKILQKYPKGVFQYSYRDLKRLHNPQYKLKK
jgi:hypothetical protein